MRRRLLRMAFIGLSLVTLLLASGTAFAAPTTPSGSTTTTTNGAEIYHVSDAECAKIRAAVAGTQFANDSRLCTFIHGWTRTVTAGSATNTNTNTNTSCPSGTATFHDYSKDPYSGAFWELDLGTSFKWTGNCSYPTLTSQQCYVRYTTNSDVSQEQCYSYHYFSSSGWSSTAAVYGAYVCTQFPLIRRCMARSQRRECYSNRSVGDCDWTNWDGR